MVVKKVTKDEELKKELEIVLKIKPHSYIMETLIRGVCKMKGVIDYEEMLKIGSRIREAREFLGLTQEEFAKNFHIDTRLLSFYETGERRIPVTFIIKMYECLKVNPIFVLFGVGSSIIKEIDLKKFFVRHENPIVSSFIEYFTENTSTPTKTIFERYAQRDMALENKMAAKEARDIRRGKKQAIKG